MNILVLDLETTVQRRDGIIDGSPFHPSNRMVSAHWRWISYESPSDGPQRAIFFHRDQGTPDSRKPLQDALDAADIVVAHNGKFDLMWLLESGFAYEGDVYDTMIGEYVLARGQRWGFSLDETAKRRGVSEKRGHLVQEMFENGTDFSEMPLDIVIEYADADVLSTAEVYLAQMEEYNRPENVGLVPVRTLMNEMLLFLVEIERNGIKIDKVALDQIEKDYLAEQAKLLETLRDISQSVMGDMPINLNSGADMSKVIYSREVIDRALHISTWNIGTDARGKPLRTPRMSPTEFSRAVKMTTKVIERQTAYHCKPCSGTGMIRKIKKNGEPHKNMNKCPDCGGRGVQLVNSGQKAGLKLVPTDPTFVCMHGFKSDKGTIKRLIAQAQTKGLLDAEVFLKSLSRLNAVSSYLSSFVNGINFWCRDNDILHANFNQCVTATGRLSSSQINFQNLPKEGRFPIRRAIVSRFDGGCIMEADYSGLEFRVAAELSRDAQMVEDILTGKDVHVQTACIVNECTPIEVTKDMRGAAKAHTFAPLYQATGLDQPPHIRRYYQEFYNIYKGMARKQNEWTSGVLKNGIVRTPSGREYRFIGVKRGPNGRVSNITSIVNYPVQGFGTGDLVPLACIRLLKAFRAQDFRSKIINTVHDSLVVDVFPGEEKSVATAITKAMVGVTEEVQQRFGYTMAIPLKNEVSIGKNWMEQSDYTDHI